ncbi:MFS transporter [Conexibacter sp. JD483]|uniref:MFS transporter n=1 Tax=unclassified Conexibacter TaxID=2627773 RepID=UPI002722E5E2|nr:MULTISPECIES: MFS transporter [unclassified Conexibacter]MDO8188468.1 MFS transporter [Conexibacter sp. CPCC 205706]MDO8201456.1 MFS transporter [Conexibacter sp. CPCC 205762]MDR9371762.1 MFS transporter [Conexibacter sp. JD483]
MAEGAAAAPPPAPAAGTASPGAPSASPPRRTRALDRGFWLLFCSSALCFLSIGAYAPVLPRFVQDELGGGGLEVGLVTGITAVVAIVLRPSAGALGDRRGRRFAALIGSLVMGAGAALLLGPELLPVVLLARLAIGLGEALLSIASMAWVIDRAPNEHRGRALGAFGMSIWLGLGLGPLAAEALRVDHGFTAVWIFCTVTALASGLLLGLLPAPRSIAVDRRQQSTRLLPQIPTAALRPGAVIALALYGEGIMGAFGVIHLVGRGVPEGAQLGGAASIFTVFAAVTFAARIGAVMLVDRIGPFRCALLANLLVGGGWALFATAQGFAAAAAGAALVGAGYALLYPALGLLVTARVVAEDRGAGLGTFMAFMDMGFGAGAVAGGLIVAVASTALSFWSAAVAAVLGVALLLGPGGRPLRAVRAGDQIESVGGEPAR